MKINLIPLGIITSIVLLVLDLAGVIALPWWVILLPIFLFIFIPLVLLIVGATFALFFGMFFGLCITRDYQKNPHKYKRIVKSDGTVTYRRK